MVDKTGYSLYNNPLVTLGRKVLNACFEQIANVIIGDLYYVKTGGRDEANKPFFKMIIYIMILCYIDRTR